MLTANKVEGWMNNSTTAEQGPSIMSSTVALCRPKPVVYGCHDLLLTHPGSLGPDASGLAKHNSHGTRNESKTSGSRWS